MKQTIKICLRFVTIALFLLFALCLTGCRCTHEWQDATCAKAMICAKCGKAQGAPLNHNWSEATCAAPQICTICGETQSSALGHDWIAATCTTPKTCRVCQETSGTASGHKWINRTCTKPKTCSVCKRTEGVEAGHTWISATCEKPMTCSVCKTTFGDREPHNWIEETEASPRICSFCLTMVPKELPDTGHIFQGQYLSRYSMLTINNQLSSSSYYIKLKDSSGNDVFAFFVQAGDTIEMSVPTGAYYIYFACGDDWFGTDFAFGEDTEYTKDDEPLNLYEYDYEYTLYTVVGGNFDATTIAPEDF